MSMCRISGFRSKKGFFIFCLLVGVSLFLMSCSSLGNRGEGNKLNENGAVIEEQNQSYEEVEEVIPEVNFSATEILQGDFFSVRLRNIQEGDEIICSTDLAINTPLFYSYSDDRLAIVGVSYRTNPGDYAFCVKVIRDDTVIMEREEVITVSLKDFETQYLKVTASLQSKRSEKLLLEDLEHTVRAKSKTADYPLWEGVFLMPVEGRISTEFGVIRYINNVESSRHSGLDIAAEKGTPVKAANRGRVALSKELNVTGNTIIIDHGMNVFSSYSHLDKLHVVEGQMVEKGDMIGEVGSTGFSTGPHLHWTISIGRVFVNPWLFLDGDPLSCFDILEDIDMTD